MPVRDDTLIGKKIMHVADLGKGSGLEFVQFKVTAGKQKHHNDASGVPPARVMEVQTREFFEAHGAEEGVPSLFRLRNQRGVVPRAEKAREKEKEGGGREVRGEIIRWA